MGNEGGSAVLEGGSGRAFAMDDLSLPGSSLVASSGSFAFRMAALHDLSVELSLSRGIDELCERAVRLGRFILGVDRIGIWFVDQDDPGYIKGSFGTDESGRLRDERGRRLRRFAKALPGDFYEGKEPVYFMGGAPCFDDRMDVVGEADKALALLWDGRKAIGEVWVDNVVSKRPIGGGDLDLLVRYARIVGCLASFKLEQAELYRLSGIDELTGIVNRRTALLVLEKQFGLTLRNGGVLSVSFIDLDGLKSVNDTFGHSSGDEYIKSACSVLAKAVRGTDTIGRLGGDEFLAILPDCDILGAQAMGRRIRALVEDWNRAGDHRFGMSLSIGFASSRELPEACASATASALVELADKRMYEEKMRRKASRHP